jgi:hypothetical protein
MNEMKRASHDEAPIAVCKRQRLKNVPTRETSLTIVEISRALFAIPEEFGVVLGRKILEKRIDCDQLLDLLDSVKVPTRETSLTTAEISRALVEIPEEFGALLGRNILEKMIDCDQLLDLLNSVEPKAEEPVVTDVFCKHSHLFLPFLDRVSWNRLCSANSQIHKCNRSVSPPWPQKILRVGSAVNSVAFSPDGECLACGSVDGMVRLWNKRNGSCTLFEGHTDWVSDVSFSPNGEILASIGRDHSIRLWKLDDQSHRQLGVTMGVVTSIAFSPSGSSLASVFHQTGEVRLWDPNDGRCTRAFEVRLPYLYAVAFSPDGATLAVGARGSILLYHTEADDIDSRSPPAITIDANRENVFSLVYSPNGSFLAASVDSNVKIWRASDGSLQTVLGGPPGTTNRSVSFSPNGKLVACGNDDGIVRLWTMKDRDDNWLAVIVTMAIGWRLYMFIVPRYFQLMSARPLLQLMSTRSLLLPMDKTSRLGLKMVIFFCGTLEISCKTHCNTF